MNLNEIVNHFKVQYITADRDTDLILENYFTKFKIVFPDISESQFVSWLNEDIYGGWEDYINYNVAGRRELKVLYALIRAKKPKKILEIGTYMGDSTNHVLLAAQKNTQEGFDCEVTSVDITDYVQQKKLHDYPIKRLIQSSIDHLKNNVDYDFIIQDGDHSQNTVQSELELIKNFKNLEVLWSHDYFLQNTQIGKILEKKQYNFFDKRVVFKEPAYIAGFQVGYIKRNKI